jgi:Glycosyl hydrolase family 26
MQLLRTSARLTAAAFSLALFAVSCSDVPTSAAAEPSPTPGPETPAPQPSADRAFFGGAYLGDDVSTPERIDAAIAGWEAKTGKRPALVKTFHPVTCDFSASGWCGQVLRKVAGAGSTNYVALDLRWQGAPAGSLLEAIGAGAADAHFVRIARQLAAVPGTVLLEPGWEMNGNWSDYRWQGMANGGDASAPARYRAAWQRLVRTFREQGATNVRWVFNPNAGNPLTWRATGASHWNWYANYYPGDEYVDYVGMHGFNAPTVFGAQWATFDALFDGDGADRMLSDLAARYPTKPIIIGEFATEEGTGSAKAEWIRGAYRRLRSHPNVVGAVWFNMDKETDWRVDSTPAALAAFREVMADAGVKTAFTPVPASSSTRLASRP